MRHCHQRDNSRSCRQTTRSIASVGDEVTAVVGRATPVLAVGHQTNGAVWRENTRGAIVRAVCFGVLLVLALEIITVLQGCDEQKDSSSSVTEYPAGCCIAGRNAPSRVIAMPALPSHQHRASQTRSGFKATKWR